MCRPAVWFGCLLVLLHVTPTAAVSRSAHSFAAAFGREYEFETDGPTSADSPLLPCDQLDARWFECEDVATLQVENSTNKDSSVCPYFGEKGGVVARANITCRVLPCIECFGSRLFVREVPCVKYTGHYFISTFLYSVFLGVLAADRFYLGYSAIGVGKLMTLGGLGVWWIADIVLLLLGALKPADESEWQEWQPY
ncbi:hypothetical protein M3Y99_01719600 [Aphelenchoides fujianensis]|nr:hypothetical protein M3Y99_01719600 [Aphelenchoides fujianensis]